MITEISSDFMLSNNELLLWTSYLMLSLEENQFKTPFKFRNELITGAMAVKRLLNNGQLELIKAHLSAFKKDELNLDH